MNLIKVAFATAVACAIVIGIALMAAPNREAVSTARADVAPAVPTAPLLEKLQTMPLDNGGTLSVVRVNARPLPYLCIVASGSGGQTVSMQCDIDSSYPGPRAAALP